jgi:hypothetical protein
VEDEDEVEVKEKDIDLEKRAFSSFSWSPLKDK